MKKQLFAILTAVFITSTVFAQETEFSLGATLGSMVQQRISTSYDTTTLTAVPEIGLTADLRFSGFGIQTNFGFSWQNLNYFASENDTEQTNEKVFYETITLTPYIPFDVKDFTFIIGPTVGFQFVQVQGETPYGDYTLETYERDVLFVFGGTFRVRYRLTDNLKAFLDIPVLARPYFKTTTVEYKLNGYVQSPDLADGSWRESEIYVVPKLGMVYTF